MSQRGGLTGTLPISIGAHVVVLVFLLIVPLAGGIELPRVATRTPSYVAAMAVPSPPPRAAPAPSAVRDLASAIPHDAAPTSAPPRINPESSTLEPAAPDLPIGDAAGSPGSLGVAVENSARVLEPPPPPRTTGPVRISDLVRAPTKIVDVRPVYPALARQAKVEGTVILEAILDRSGRIDGLRVVRSVPLLDAAAIDAVHQWRYTPTVLNGQPVAVLMTITVHFTLQ